MDSKGLLIGGSSCVGKTTVAREIAARLGIVPVETDRSLPSDPRLQPLAGPPDVWDRPHDELRDLLISAAEAAIPYLTAQARALGETNAIWILEGERIHPELVERQTPHGAAVGVFVVETDADRITETLFARLPGFMSLAEPRRRAVAEVDRLYNLWLIAEASRRGLACVESQPWPTLADRLLRCVLPSTTAPNQESHRHGCLRSPR